MRDWVRGVRKLGVVMIGQHRDHCGVPILPVLDNGGGYTNPHK